MFRFLLMPLVALLASCSPLNTFNAIVPKDRDVAQVARDQIFRDGPRGRLDLYAPLNRAADARLPVIVFFYGGSWASGAKDGYAFVGRALAAQGFLVAIPDYRLVPDVRYPQFLEDGAEAVRWVRGNAARFGGDGERIVLAGHSAGAYNAAMLAFDQRWLGQDTKAVRGFAGLAGPYSFLPLDNPATRAAFGRERDLAATQPVSHAGPGDPPALLLVAGKDNLVYPHNAERLAAALGRGGVAVDVRTYAGVGHVGIVIAIARPFRRKAPVLRDLADFARRATAPTPRTPATR
ncbi:MAG TPA: alpha/beta hydrolase [Allosphingosinicella sp.]|jgi:acetyl esterase/lipase|uniref:alpha/beta hydrolase n=1 Tax=Allosphingosinicella sp. TaxID=2823234 RepID=UPI002F271385